MKKNIIVLVILILIAGGVYIFSQQEKQVGINDEFGRYIGPGCKVWSGCNGPILCGDIKDEESGSICDARPEYACYEENFARCEKQSSGYCGWAQTEEFKQCVKSARVSENSVNTNIGRNSTFSTNLEGYKQSCTNNVNIYKFKDDYFVKAENEPVSFHYVDDELATNYCDVVTCKKIDNPYVVKLFDYKKIGEKVVPKDETSRLSGLKLPVYHPEILKGTLKIDINYFSDSKCEIPKTFSKTIKN